MQIGGAYIMVQHNMRVWMLYHGLMTNVGPFISFAKHISRDLLMYVFKQTRHSGSFA
jgi:hypothetical protein